MDWLKESLKVRWVRVEGSPARSPLYAMLNIMWVICLNLLHLVVGAYIISFCGLYIEKVS